MEKVDIRLDKLVLRNYKGFYTGDDENGVEITFDENLTVFIGDNGSGKSAVLDAVALFLGKLRMEITGGEIANRFQFPPITPSNIKFNKDINNRIKEKELEEELDEDANSRIKERDKNARCELDGTFQLSPNTIIDKIYEESLNDDEDYREEKREPKIGFSIGMKKYESPNKIKITEWQHHSYKEFKDDYDSDERTLQLFIELMKKEEVDNLPILVFYGANSINTNLKKKENTLSSSMFDAYENALEAERFDFNDFFAWYEDQQKKDLMRKKIGVSRKQANNLVKIGFVETAVSAVLDDDKVNFKDLFIDWFSEPNDIKITKEDTVQKTTSLEELSDEEIIPLSFSQLSSGERTLIALVADLTRRLCLANPNAKSPLDGNGIVLIDEIDVHLHPNWQRKVMPKLREVFPNVQFIITAHSPYVISASEPKNIRIITKDEKTEQNIIINAGEKDEDGKIRKTKGLDPNRILKEIMGTPLRDFDTQERIKELENLINIENIDKAKTQELISQLTKDLGLKDSYIMRLNHRIFKLKRRKVTI